MIKFDQIVKRFNVGTPDETTLFDRFSLEVEKGEFVSIVGSNGSGKTTLLNLLCGTLPLDGGRMIFCVGYYVFPIAALTKALSLGGMVVGATLIVFGLYGAILWEKLNLSLLLVGGYLIAYAHQNRSALQLENLYALLQERQPDKKAPVSLKLYAAAPEAALLSFVDAIADNRAALFRIGEEWVDEEQVIRALMQNPRAIAAETLEKADNFHENDGKCLQHQPL